MTILSILPPNKQSTRQTYGSNTLLQTPCDAQTFNQWDITDWIHARSEEHHAWDSGCASQQHQCKKTAACPPVAQLSQKGLSLVSEQAESVQTI